MAVVKPFRGLRPLPELAAQLSSLPYDVLDTDEASRIARQNQNSFLRVTKAEIDLPGGTDPHSAAVYGQARWNLADFVARGLLRQDRKPCYYVYRQRWGEHEQIGLAAAFSLDEYENNAIRKHELTRPDKEQDRLEHILATGAQTGPVFLTYREHAGVNAVLTRAMQMQPAVSFIAADGVLHSLYVVDQPELTAAIEQAFADVDRLYIADGHHRSAAAAKARARLRSLNPGHTGAEAYNFFLAVAFSHTMVKIMDYNRVVSDLAGMTEGDFLSRLGARFSVCRQDGPLKPSQPRQFGLYLPGRWYQLHLKPGPVPAGLAGGLDVSLLQENLLAPLLGIRDVRTDKRIGFVGGVRGMAELERLVDSGRYAAAFALYPTSIAELMAIADADEIMPPKSTWFEPKLRDAMIVHLITPNE